MHRRALSEGRHVGRRAFCGELHRGREVEIVGIIGLLVVLILIVLLLRLI
jgi:hypothetical protein